MDDNTETTEGKGVVFTYIGDPNDDGAGPRVATIFGYEFTKDEAARVPNGTEDEKNIVRKMRGHSHLVEDGHDLPKFSKNGPADELPSLSLEDMKDVARGEGLEFPDDTTKPKLMRALRAHRRNQG